MSSTPHHRLSPRRAVTAALVSAGLAAASVAPASAATTNTVWCSGGNCPAGAIQAAIDSTPSGGTVQLSAGTYWGDVTVDRSITLAGPAVSGKNAPTATINGGNSSSVPGSVLTVPSGVTAQVQGVNVEGGYANGSRSGGGIDNAGSLTLSQVWVTNNHGSSQALGGGIYNQGSLTLSVSEVNGNSAGYGGGIENRGSLVSKELVTNGNSATYNGGGLDNAFGGAATLGITEIKGNSAGSAGGGIANFEAQVHLGALSVVTGNTAGSGGGIYAWSNTTPSSQVNVSSGATVQNNAPNNTVGPVVTQ